MMAPYQSVAGAPASFSRMPAGTTATAPVMPEIRPSFEFASTSSSWVRTVDGTSADFDTMYVFCSTREANTSGNSARLSMLLAIRIISTTRAAASSWITSRRPPATRSIKGPISGAMTRNGAKLNARNSITRERAASRSMLKNSESARATTIAASPPIIRACVIASRRNFDAGGLRSIPATHPRDYETRCVRILRGRPAESDANVIRVRPVRTCSRGRGW